MNKTLRGILAASLSLIFIISAAASVFAADFPTKRASVYVYDTAEVISAETENDINTRADALYAMTGAQIMIVCVKTTGSTSIAQYTSELFTEWQVGCTQRQNGILLVMATEDRSYWLLQGNGIKSDLTDGFLQVINNDYLEGHFAEGKYDDGARAVFDRLIEKFESLYSVDVTKWDGKYIDFNYSDGNSGETKQDGGEEKSTFSVKGFFKVLLWIVVAVAVIVVVILLVRAFRKPKYVGRKIKPQSPSPRSFNINLSGNTAQTRRPVQRPQGGQTRAVNGQRQANGQNRTVNGQRPMNGQMRTVNGQRPMSGQMRPQNVQRPVQMPQGQRTADGQYRRPAQQGQNGQNVNAGARRPQPDRTVYPQNPPYVGGGNNGNDRGGGR